MGDVDGAVMEVVHFHHEGERHYKEGNILRAMDSFQTALEKAKSINESHIENICTHNLASVYAANGNKEELEQLLQNLPNQFIDDMLREGGNSILYLRAVANRSIWHYEQALTAPNDSKNYTYLLEQLVKLHGEESDKRMQIRYLKQLTEAYQVRRDDIRRFEVTCQLAQLYILEAKTEDAKKILRELKKEIADYTLLWTGNTSWGTRLMGTEEVQEMRCLVSLWNDIGLKFTLLTQYDKALECFENGLKLIPDDTPTSQLNTAVLRQNIGAVRNMRGGTKEDFEIAIQFHLDAIKTFDDYAKARQGSNKRGKKLLRREKLGNDGRLVYTLPIENKGRMVIYEALECDQRAAAGAARSYLNLGNAHVKLEDIMDAQQTYSYASTYAHKAQDTRTMMQANEALASVAMHHHDSCAARKYLLTAMKLAVSTDGREDDEGQGQHDNSDVQRIANKLSKLPVTMRADMEDLSSTADHWATLRESTRRRLP